MTQAGLFVIVEFDLLNILLILLSGGLTWRIARWRMIEEEIVMYFFVFWTVFTAISPWMFNEKWFSGEV